MKRIAFLIPVLITLACDHVTPTTLLQSPDAVAFTTTRQQDSTVNFITKEWINHTANFTTIPTTGGVILSLINHKNGDAIFSAKIWSENGVTHIRYGIGRDTIFGLRLVQDWAEAPFLTLRADRNQ